MTISVAQAQLFFLALTRILAVLVHVPVLAGRLVPNMVRIGFGLILTFVLLPWNVLPADSAAMPLLGFSLAIGKEILTGTLAGFGAALTFGALQIAGEVMSTSSAFGSAQMLNPAFQEQGTSYSSILSILAIMIFLLMDGHFQVLLATQRTFEIFPINGSITGFSMGKLMLTSAQLVSTGIHMSLPILGAMLLVEIAFGLLAKVAPQVQVFFLAIPLKAGLALVGLAIALNVLYPFIFNLFERMGERMMNLLAG
ncbi:MAG: flagellar biosynthetic protein FliR [Anaerolineales bacterium]|nr:flagellar biosynthetic protein FliR [Anaerolineales bacterium]